VNAFNGRGFANLHFAKIYLAGASQQRYYDLPWKILPTTSAPRICNRARTKSRGRQLDPRLQRRHALFEPSPFLDGGQGKGKSKPRPPGDQGRKGKGCAQYGAKYGPPPRRRTTRGRVFQCACLRPLSGSWSPIPPSAPGSRRRRQIRARDATRRDSTCARELPNPGLGNQNKRRD
jgi:hypothetical protein